MAFNARLSRENLVATDADAIHNGGVKKPIFRSKSLMNRWGTECAGHWDGGRFVKAKWSRGTSEA